MESIFTFLLLFILGPIVKGLIESEKTRKQWEEKQHKQQVNPRAWPKMHNTELQRSYKRQFHDINAERTKTSPIYTECQDKDYIPDGETAVFANLVDKKSEDTRKATRGTQADITKSSLQQPDKQIKPSSEHEAFSLEDTFSGNNLMYAIVLNEIFGPPRARK